MLDSNPTYETAYTESSMVSQAIDNNPQYMDYEEDENEDHPSNSVDQRDDYDYMGNWKSTLYQLITFSFMWDYCIGMQI